MVALPPLAITAALTAAQLVVGAFRQIEGPRLTDTKGTVADYGAPLNYSMGERLLTCLCFFAKDIVEIKHKRKGNSDRTAATF